MLVVRAPLPRVVVTIEFLDASPTYGEVCTELLFIPHERDPAFSDLIPQCHTLFPPRYSRRLEDWFNAGTVIIYGDKYFIAKDGCSGTVATAAGTVSVKNLCHIDDKTLEEVAKEVAEVFNIPYAKAAANKAAVALYYSAKIGAAEFVQLPSRAEKKEQKKQEQKPKELAELEELWRRLLELAKTIPPDQELEVEPI